MPTSSLPAPNTLDRLYALWFLLVFGVVAFGTLLTIAVLPGQERRRSAARRGAQLLFRLTGSWPDIDGISRLPTDASVVVANHASYLDGILLTAVLPPKYQFVIKREMTQVPLAHFFLRRVGAHFVERFDARKGASDARRIMQSASNGGSLAFFPEGTFRREPGLRRFQNGAFTIAARQMLPVVPLVIKGTRQMLPAQVWLPRPAHLEVIIGEPIPPSAAMNPLAARDLSRTQILALLDEPDLHTESGTPQ